MTDDKKERVKNTAPSRTTIHELTSIYYGSHEELGEGDFQFFVAIPDGSTLPKMEIGHGHSGRSVSDLASLPVGSYVNWDEEWELVSDYLNSGDGYY